MKRICAWCLKFMGEKEPLKDKRKTHGICDSCFPKVTEEYMKRKGEEANARGRSRGAGDVCSVVE